MGVDASGLQSTAVHQKPRNTSEELSPNFISNIGSSEFIEETKNLEIHEHFKLRIQTYKSWASCICRKNCPEFLIDGFKSDVSNDFRLMINWLAITSEERRVILESNHNSKNFMGLDVALDMLYRMGIHHKRLKGPTVDAFRELIAVLCGGIRGQIPRLDSLANFSERSQFCDEESSSAIIKIVKTILNPCSNTTPMVLSDETVLNSCSIVEGPSRSHASVDEISVNIAPKSHSGRSPLKSPTVSKQKKGIDSQNKCQYNINLSPYVFRNICN
ncbi:hypothetical protein DICVIV_01483 [Dictyocaulus viviparus]|uniref:Uncharacterized protein n=1 Tax=Dictyocaulus viviparus TaxID=29172 RepID=A0A0D8YCI5_DICVI|nr:hypothetical protein DICVIV_01483 [Dictyocaulus viviparus]